MLKTSLYLILILTLLLLQFSCKRKRHADITGKVIDINSGEGVSGCTITILSDFKDSKPGKYQPCNCEVYSTTSSADGSFKFDRITFKKPIMKGYFGIPGLYALINEPEITSNNIKYFGRTKLDYELVAICLCEIKLKIFSSISGSAYTKHTSNYMHPNSLIQSYGQNPYSIYNSTYYYIIPSYQNGYFIVNSNAFDAGNNLLKSQIDTIKNLPCAGILDYTITIQ